ncbi:MAG: alpha-galactosidase [Salinivirgaceae bacterium]|jgi:alpha-galactosidase|nr:alpha-galactosidase [Salinivirgaceae bacterium]
MKYFYSVIFILFNILNAAFAQNVNKLCKAELVGEKLKISNNVVSFYYNWNSGNVKLSGFQISGKNIVELQKPENSISQYGQVMKGDQLAEDLKLFTKEFSAQNVKLATQIKSRFAGEKEFLEVSVSYSLGGLEIKRIWEVFPNTTAISTYYYLKGKPDESWIGSLQQQSSNDLIENVSLLKSKEANQRIGFLPIPGKHWHGKIITFQDVTDHNNTLVNEKFVSPYTKASLLQGNLLLLRNKISNLGIFVLKESPLEFNQQSYPGADFSISETQVEIMGTGISKENINAETWSRSYGYVIGLSSSEEIDQLLALRTYQKTIRSIKENRDEMVMSNTWGDRSQDSRMNESFILKELEAAAKLGITHFQLDDGWQQGLSRNSSNKQGEKWNSWTLEDWLPHKERFPNGFGVIADKAKSLNIKLGLWFNPSRENNYETWKRDAEILTGYYQKYQVTAFKIDGVELKNKESEDNLRKFFDEVNQKTNGNIIFNLDLTAGRRAGYHFFNEYGNAFLENRYSDWQNYYPHNTLRNLWMLSKYVPAEKLQIEWLNTWRNKKGYGLSDPLAPGNIPWDYAMAITFMAQPLAWMETSSLPEEAFKHVELLKKYKAVQHQIHQGAILPIGEMPDGFSWTGFQSVNEGKGYFMIYRELSPKVEMKLKTWLQPGQKLKLTPVLGNGKAFTTTVDASSEIQFKLDNKLSFALYAYQLL